MEIEERMENYHCQQKICKIEWINIIPSNLRKIDFSFLSSKIIGHFNENNLDRFIKLYIYLMYDKEEKIFLCKKILKNEIYINNIYNLLYSSCLSNRSDFNRLLNEQLEEMKNLMISLEDFIDEDNPNENSRREIITMAHNSLEEILQFIKNEEFFEKIELQNLECRNILNNNNNNNDNDDILSLGLESKKKLYEIWLEYLEILNNPNISENDENYRNVLISLIIKDMIISTAADTPITFSFILRMILLFTFLLINFRQDEIEFHLDDSINDEEIKCINHGESINCDNLISTVIIFLIRSFFYNSLFWPLSLKENIFKEDKNEKDFIIELKKVLKKDRISGGEFPWIRIINKRKNFQRTDDKNSIDQTSFISVNFNYILGLYEQLGMSHDKINSISKNKNFNIKLKLNDKLNKEYTNYTNLFNLCLNLFKSKYPNISDDLSESMILPLFCSLNLSKSRIRDVISRENHLINIKNNNELFIILELIIIQKLYKIRITERLIRNFIDYSIDIWNTKIGLCNFKQFAEVTLEIYKLLIRYGNVEQK